MRPGMIHWVCPETAWQLLNRVNGLPGQWHAVFPTCLHAFGRHSPDGLIEVELVPFGFSNLAGAGKREDEQTQGQTGGGISVVRFEGAEEFRQLLNGKSGLGFFLAGLQVMV